MKYLVSLLFAVSAFAQTKAEWIPLVNISGTAVPVTYVPTPQYSGAKALRFIRLQNLTNCSVTVSFDGANDNYILPVPVTNNISVAEINLANNNMYLGGTIRLRGTSCTTGNFYIQGAY